MADVTIPDTPQTRTEQYLAAANGQEVELPDPMTREEAYLNEIATKMQGGGSGVTVEPLSVTQNGEYTAPSGKAYSPVTVAVKSDNNKAKIIDRSITNLGLNDFDGASTIGKYSFAYCEDLETAVIDVAILGDSSFYHDSKLQSITLLDGVASIGNAVFSNCISLKQIVLPNTVTSLGVSAFRFCSSLESVILSESLSTLNNYTFASCPNLATITIPESVTEIGAGCFMNFSSLKVHMKGTTPPKIESNTFDGETYPMIYVPRSEGQAVLNAYRSATNWARYNNCIEEEPV